MKLRYYRLIEKTIKSPYIGKHSFEAIDTGNLVAQSRFIIEERKPWSWKWVQVSSPYFSLEEAMVHIAALKEKPAVKVLQKFSVITELEQLKY